jgi:phosphate/sulfate permease
LLILTAVFSFLMSFSIGSNDAANSLATTYGSGGMALRKLVVIGAISEFIGAFFFSDAVTATLATKMIPELPEKTFEEQRKMMFAVCLASFVFIMTSSFSKMPISGTHTVVGALLGAGIAETGVEGLNWSKVAKVFASWFISPAFSGGMTCIIFVLLCRFTLDTSAYSFYTRIQALQIISGFSFTAITIILNFKVLRNKDNLMLYVIPAGVSFVLGIIACRLLFVWKLYDSALEKKYQWLNYLFYAVCMPWKADFIEKLTCNIKVGDSSPSDSWYPGKEAGEDKYLNTAPQISVNEKISFEEGDIDSYIGKFHREATVLTSITKVNPVDVAEVAEVAVHEGGVGEIGGVK